MKTKRNKLRQIIAVLSGVVVLFTACGSDESITVTEVSELINSEAAEIEQTVTINDTDIVASVMNGIVYDDGTYTGVAQGFGEGLTVELVIKDRTIISVEVVDHNEREEKYYGTPIATIPGAIVDAQNPIVDSVSGATCTSYGIMNACIDALSQAISSGDLPETLELPESKGRH